MLEDKFFMCYQREKNQVNDILRHDRPAQDL